MNMAKLRVLTETGPPPIDWLLPLPGCDASFAAFSAISVCALLMSSILQCAIGGASGASGGSLGLLNPNGVTSGWFVCAPACGMSDKSSKCPLNTGGEPGFVVRPATNPSRAAVITTNGNNRFIGQSPLRNGSGSDWPWSKFDRKFEIISSDP